MCFFVIFGDATVGYLGIANQRIDTVYTCMLNGEICYLKVIKILKRGIWSEFKNLNSIYK